MVYPDTCAGLSDIKTKIETINISQFKQDTPKANLQIEEWMNDISIHGDNCSENLRLKINLYSLSSWQLFRDYIKISMSKYEEDK